MVLKQIITRNIQNHKEVVIDLPSTGFIVFTGNNSNGKSVIVKATKALITGHINKPRKRAGLINRNSQWGEIEYVRDDDHRLILHLTREAATTWVRYICPGMEPITRYLADRNYSELVQLFGWHYDASSGITLNIAEADESLLFYKTNNKTNASILKTATSDLRADLALLNATNLIKESRHLRENWTSQMRVIANTLKDLNVEDTTELVKSHEYLSFLYRNLSKVYIPTLPKIEPVPNVSYLKVNFPNLPEVKYPKIVSCNVNIPDISSICTELEELKSRRCPTCGRGFECDC